MRQAGRSLPEYRAIRGEGSILDAIKRPELAAEITLQPVRRYGVDAAVLYSDIVVPVHAIGFGVDVAPGTGPVVAEPVPARRRPRPPPAARARGGHAVRPRDGPPAGQGARPSRCIGFAGAPFTVASYLIEGRPVAHLRATKALMYSDEPLWHALLERLADLAVASLRSQVANGAQAVQLFDSWAGALAPADYERYVLPHSRRVFEGLADLDVPRSTSASTPASCSGLMAEAGPDVVGVDWRTPLDAARQRIDAAAGGRAVGVQGNLDPAVVPQPVAGRRGQGARGARRQRRPPRPRLQPGPRRPARDRPRHPRPGGGDGPRGDRTLTPHRQRDGRAPSAMSRDRRRCSMAYGTPAPAPTRSSPTTPTSAVAGRRRPSCWPTWCAATRPSAASRPLAAAHRGAAGGAPAGARRRRARPLRGGARAEARRAEHRGRRPGAGPAAPGSRSVVGLVLAPHYSAFSVGQYLERAEAAGAAEGVPVTGIRSWHLEPAYLEFLVAAVRRQLADLPTATTGPLHRAQPPGAHPRRRATRTPSSCGPRRPRSPSGPGWRAVDVGRRVAVGRPDAGAVARAGRPDGHRRPGRPRRRRRRARVRRAGSSPTTSRCCTTWTSRPAARADGRGLAFARTACVNDDREVMAALAGLVVDRVAAPR